MMRSLTFITIGCSLLLAAALVYGMMDHPQTVTVLIDGQEQQIETTADSVYGALEEAGITTRDNDVIEPALSADLPKKRLIVIQRAKEITLIMGYGESRRVRTQARQVKDLLAERGIKKRRRMISIRPLTLC